MPSLFFTEHYKVLEPGAADQAMERGREARRSGSPCRAPVTEPLLTTTWWFLGWVEEDERLRREALQGEEAP